MCTVLLYNQACCFQFFKLSGGCPLSHRDPAFYLTKQKCRLYMGLHLLTHLDSLVGDNCIHDPQVSQLLTLIRQSRQGLICDTSKNRKYARVAMKFPCFFERKKPQPQDRFCSLLNPEWFIAPSFPPTLLENLTDEAITQLYVTKSSTISLHLMKVYVT